MIPDDPQYIIAIGASAGGIEELNDFFDHTPLDGAAYVIIQHLSADFKSRMVELLARHSQLEVREAENGILVKRNVVYLIPNSKFMTINNGKLQLTDKSEVKGIHLTINDFFNSLADDQGSRAIGVILSGLGSDGTDGVKAIKEAGGMVIARDPATSAFNNMPASAISTGLVDFILEPKQMPAAIEEYTLSKQAFVEDKLDVVSIDTIITLISAQLPLDFSGYKKNTITRRIKRRVIHGGFTTINKYLEFLKDTPGEVEALAQDFLISVTSFFRDKEAFQFIQEEVIPKILKQLAPDEELKLWVAGCATGEEAYSLAILICELLTGNYENTIVKIFATDIDLQALVHAGNGIYDASIVKQLSADRIERFFIKQGSSYKIKPEIRKMVVFAQHDIARNPPYCNMQLITCRNLLIYMTPMLQRKIFSMLHFGMKLNGYLFLGTSENPTAIIDSLEIVSKKWKIYRNVTSNRNARFDMFTLPGIMNMKPIPALNIKNKKIKGHTINLSEAVNEALVKELDCLIVCIDFNFNVVKTYGDTTQYLLQRNFTLNLAELLPSPLALAFNILTVRAKKENSPARVDGISLQHAKKTMTVNLSVTPITLKKDEDQLLMVVFSKGGTAPLPEIVVFDQRLYHDQYIKNIEEELRELKENLRSAYAELDSTNENMQSFNEELLSANEEMQSTNEEMQSVNEELHTINSDYQQKNKELLELNDDLNNYFRSNINGQLFVNHDLLLMKFSPGATKIINLLETDIGRPLSNITTNIKIHTIIDDIKSVLEKGAVIHKEVETYDGKWYQVMSMPYVRFPDQKMTGAILTFNDITALKKVQQELDRKNKTLELINEDLDHFVHAASHDLLAPLANIETSIAVMNRMPLSDAKLQEFINLIGSSVKKFSALIKDISTIALVENNSSFKEAVDIEELLQNIEWSLEGKIKASGAVISRQLEVKTVTFSKKNLRSILYNLISNGIKFRREVSPVIHIEVKREENNIMITVEDNGKGIRSRDLDKAFSLYGRLDQNVEGHGVGLYLTKKIIHAAGGNITVESELGKGTRFIIHIKTSDKVSS